MVDREALERRIRRLEARSEIADKRRVSAQTDLTEVVHKLHKIEGRVVDVENLASPASVSEEPRCLDIRTRRVSLKQIRQPEPAREGDIQEVQER